MIRRLLFISAFVFSSGLMTACSHGHQHGDDATKECPMNKDGKHDCKDCSGCKDCKEGECEMKH